MLVAGCGTFLSTESALLEARNSLVKAYPFPTRLFLVLQKPESFRQSQHRADRTAGARAGCGDGAGTVSRVRTSGVRDHGQTPERQLQLGRYGSSHGENPNLVFGQGRADACNVRRPATLHQLCSGGKHPSTRKIASASLIRGDVYGRVAGHGPLRFGTGPTASCTCPQTSRRLDLFRMARSPRPPLAVAARCPPLILILPARAPIWCQRCSWPGVAIFLYISDQRGACKSRARARRTRGRR
jgi:hypothetical protein